MDIDQDGCIDSTEDTDDDNDGVADPADDCMYTTPGMEVDANGCSGIQLDDDDDGVHNLNDLCPASPIGERVSSTGCPVKVTVDDKSQSGADSESSSSLTWILFTIAGVLIVIALIVTLKPQPPLPAKVIPNVTESTVDDGRGQGDSGATSADVEIASLNVDAGDSQLVTDEY